jgi:hypothetical protein
MTTPAQGGDPMITSDRTKWFALALLCAVQFMVVLDSKD